MLQLNDKTFGKYNIIFKLYIPDGNLGYFNVLQDFSGTNSIWGLQVYFNLNGIGGVDGNGANAAVFNFDYDQWLDIKIFVDLDNDWCQFLVNDEMIHEYQWSKGTYGSGILKLDGINFYAWNDGGNPLYYIDDVVYEHILYDNQTLQIDEGWSGISSYLHPADPAVEQMMSAIEEQLIILKDYNGNVYQVPDQNTIINWDYSKGYFIKMGSPSTLDIIGLSPMSKQISLQAGWNLVPVLGGDAVTIEDYFGGKITKVEIVTEVAGLQVYWPEKEIETLNLLMPGRAYLVKAEEPFVLFEVPQLTTSSVNSITSVTAFSGGNVTSHGGLPVTGRGIVWSTTANPTLITNTGMTSNGTGNGEFTSYLTGLTPSTIYYVRAYATNHYGTAFGNEVSFTTPSTPSTPQLTLSLSSLEVTHPEPGEVTNQTITVTNSGSQPLDFDLSYGTSMTGMAGPGNNALIHYDEMSENPQPEMNTAHFSEAAPGSFPGREEILTDAMFDKQFEYSVGTANSQAGIETDGNYIYVTRWNGTEIFRYNLNGSYLGSFTIPGVSGIRDLAYDGTYFYGSAANTTVFKMDFVAKILVSTLTAPTVVRAIAYDQVSDGFWANNWSTPLTLFSRTGAVVKTISLVGDENFYGLAWDPQGPFLWGYSQRAGTSQNLLYKYALPAGTYLQQFDVKPLLSLAMTGDIAGGLAFYENLVPGTYSIIGVVQGRCIWGLEVGTTVVPWLEAMPVSGNLTPGQSVSIQVTLNSTSQECGELIDNLVFTSNDPNGPQEVSVKLTSAYQDCLPLVVTQEITNIDFYDATVIGTVEDDGGVPVYPRGFVWGRMENPTLDSNEGFSNNGAGLGDFSTEMTDLIPFEVYHVRAYAKNESGIVYGEQLNFMPAVLAPSIPNVFTYGADNITAFTATAGGFVAFDGYAEVTSRGLVWSRSYDPTLNNNEGHDPDNEGGLGIFTSDLDGLIPATTYYMRAYATNVIGTAYGPNVEFTTLSVYLPSVYTKQATEITSNSAVSGGIVQDDGNDPYTIRGIVWSTSEEPTIDDYLGIREDNNGVGEGDYTLVIDGLSPNTTYYVRAYAINIAGIKYGQEISFTTPEIAPAVVTTAEVTNITSNSAVCGGNVLDDGNYIVTMRGVVWDTSINPTVENNGGITFDGSGMGSFVSTMLDLEPNTTYYVRAYAINEIGIGYGTEKTFTTYSWIPCPGIPSFTYGGQTYNTVQIGDQCWMRENLNYGSKIDVTEQPTNNGIVEKYCYADDSENCSIYGGLYYWNEIMNWSTGNGAQGICPNGWHIPTDSEWCELTTYLDQTVNCATNGNYTGTNIAYKMMSTEYWTQNVLITNESGFTALPAGFRAPNGTGGWFGALGTQTVFWTSSATYPPWVWELVNGHSDIRRWKNTPYFAFSIRCIKD